MTTESDPNAKENPVHPECARVGCVWCMHCDPYGTDDPDDGGSFDCDSPRSHHRWQHVFPATDDDLYDGIENHPEDLLDTEEDD